MNIERRRVLVARNVVSIRLSVLNRQIAIGTDFKLGRHG